MKRRPRITARSSSAMSAKKGGVRKKRSMTTNLKAKRGGTFKIKSVKRRK